MTNAPRLITETMELMINLHDQGAAAAYISTKRGLLWRFGKTIMQHQLPRHQIIIAWWVQDYMDEGGSVRWQIHDNTIGVLLTRSGEWVPLEEIGYSDLAGFYRKPGMPSLRDLAIVPAKKEQPA